MVALEEEDGIGVVEYLRQTVPNLGVYLALN